MNLKINQVVLLILTAVIVIAFFLPWVNVASAQIGFVSKILTGANQDSIQKISAYQVPVLANGADSRLIISIIKIFNPSVTDADKKSYLIWGIPIFAIIILGLLTKIKNKKWLYLAFGAIGCAIFVVGVFKIKTTDLDKLILQIKMGSGLWLTLWGYLGIGLLCAYNFVLELKKR
ncbi:MAG: hypothetical protein P9M12_02930 [Candidatus Aceula lacicola]|nr:hypothetical protein [Candidatus Aceula lacicola]